MAADNQTPRAQPVERGTAPAGAVGPQLAAAPPYPAAPVQPVRWQQAVALSYRDGDPAPRVVARGQGLLAAEIIRRADQAGIYVHQSAELVGLLMGLDLDRHIPPQLYLAVAELLAWLHDTEQAHASAKGRNP